VVNDVDVNIEQYAQGIRRLWPLTIAVAGFVVFA